MMVSLHMKLLQQCHMQCKATVCAGPWQSGSAAGESGQVHHQPWQSGSASGESHPQPWQSGSAVGESGHMHHQPWHIFAPLDIIVLRCL